MALRWGPLVCGLQDARPSTTTRSRELTGSRQAGDFGAGVRFGAVPHEALVGLVLLVQLPGRVVVEIW